MRILSEENLTVVSTFVADLNDLEDPDDDDDDCSVSKLSFFEVPDLLREEDLQVSDDKYFETRLRELTRMTEAKKQQQQESPPAQSNRFTDPRFKDVDTKEGLSTFSPSSEKAPPAAESSPEVLPEVMTPQKQFLLLNQTLRRPDGSSNPDMDLVTSSCDPASSCNPTITGGGVPVTPNSNLVPLTKRSPGSGQSNSDPEDEPVLSKSSDPLPRQESSKKEPTKKREISNIAFMLLRLFGSSRKKGSTKKGCEKRSKSCDRELDSAAAPPPPPQKSIKSASSSPMKWTDRKSKTDSKLKLFKNPDELSDASRRPLTPSTLSLAATEWEFQAQHQEEDEDEANGNQELLNATYLNNYLDDPRLTGTYQYSAVLQRQERKSSGYDSLEGENSSLDSSGGNGNGGSTDISPRGGAGDPWTNVYRTTGSHYRSPVVAADPYRTTAGDTAADQYSRLYAELDDIAMLKLEINRHPDILNKNY